MGEACISDGDCQVPICTASLFPRIITGHGPAAGMGDLPGQKHPAYLIGAFPFLYLEILIIAWCMIERMNQLYYLELSVLNYFSILV